MREAVITSEEKQNLVEVGRFQTGLRELAFIPEVLVSLLRHLGSKNKQTEALNLPGIPGNKADGKEGVGGSFNEQSRGTPAVHRVLILVLGKP